MILIRFLRSFSYFVVKTGCFACRYYGTLCAWIHFFFQVIMNYHLFKYMILLGLPQFALYTKKLLENGSLLLFLMLHALHRVFYRFAQGINKLYLYDLDLNEFMSIVVEKKASSVRVEFYFMSFMMRFMFL